MIDWSALPGWFTWHSVYKRWAQEVPADGLIVEVGVYCGRSLGFLLNALDTCGSTARVIAVDVWSDPDVFEVYCAQVASHPRVTTLRMSSAEAARLVPRADYVWIDADHAYDSVRADLEAWWPVCALEMGGHDYGFGSVSRAVREFGRQHGTTVEVIQSDEPSLPMASWLVRSRR